MPPSEERLGSFPFRFLLALWIMVRVAVITATWLIIFWGSFLGYLVVPTVLLSVFTLLYTVVDISQFQRVRDVEARRQAREEVLRQSRR